METLMPHASNRQTETAVTSLAVVGFIALVAVGIWLAVYATRFVPPVVNGIGEAAVYIGSIFTPAPEPSLSIVSAPATIFFGEASTTPAVVTTTAPKVKVVEQTAGEKTIGVYQIGGTVASAPYGLPDLEVNIIEVGYFATTSTDNLFIASPIAPAGTRPAVKFTVKNIGTNVTGAWRFSASIPTVPVRVYQSDLQKSLASGDSIDYTLGFDRASVGADQVISITANPTHTVLESNFANNGTSTKVTILGY